MVNSTLGWIILGGALCMTELIFPTAFVSFMMGISALLVALISLFLPQNALLVSLWMIFSIALTVISRHFFSPKHKTIITGDDTEAKAIGGIPAGTTGRVLYEGNSWQAKCADETRDIAPNEAVYVLDKQGNTLVVLPSKMLG